MHPYMTPWSVMAQEVMPSALSRSTSLGMRHAPSSRLYSVCRCRCVKLMGATSVRYFFIMDYSTKPFP